MDFRVGDVVRRRSYAGDIYFLIKEIRGDIAYLSGLVQRLQADAPLKDLMIVDREKREVLGK